MSAVKIETGQTYRVRLPGGSIEVCEIEFINLFLESVTVRPVRDGVTFAPDITYTVDLGAVLEPA